jgi:hypothetical protein
VNEVQTILPQSGAGALMQIIERAATDPTYDVAKLQALLDVRDRWEASEARRAFTAALNAFKAKPPRITKNKTVSFDRTTYRHATLDNVCDQIAAALADHGLSHRWGVIQEGGTIKVCCILTHVMGHSERVELEGPPDDSGKKNKIQQVGSTVTYLQRYTLLAITGLATSDQDDDGHGAGREEERPDPWTEPFKDAALAAAEKGAKSYVTWFQGQEKEWREAAVFTSFHLDMKAKATENEKAA